jgi:hypothetical protein
VSRGPSLLILRSPLAAVLRQLRGIALWPRRGVGDLLRTHDRHQRFYDTLAHYPPRATPNQGKHMGHLANIDHFVVLMLENRSFGSMLGMLYPASARFDGLICSDNRDHLSCREREQP